MAPNVGLRDVRWLSGVEAPHVALRRVNPVGRRGDRVGGFRYLTVHLIRANFLLRSSASGFCQPPSSAIGMSSNFRIITVTPGFAGKNI